MKVVKICIWVLKRFYSARFWPHGSLIHKYFLYACYELKGNGYGVYFFSSSKKGTTVTTTNGLALVKKHKAEVQCKPKKNIPSAIKAIKPKSIMESDAFVKCCNKTYNERKYCIFLQ